MKKFFILTGTLFPFYVYTQNWDSLGGGLNSDLSIIYSDTVDTTLYAAGNFSLAGGTQANGIAKWNGSTWDSMYCSGLNINPPNIYAVVRYKGELYAEGNFWSTTARHFVKWNGNCWDSISKVQGSFQKFIIYNNDIYACGNFTNVGGVSANYIAKYDGSNWNAMPGDTAWNYNIYSIAFYNGELYAAGGFYNANTGMRGIAKWNGTFWEKPGGVTLYGTLAGVTDMIIYNNELYIAGSFTKSNGNVGDNIQKWNGTGWSEVGGGTGGVFNDPQYGYIFDLETNNNKLYAVGTFEYAGGVPANRIGIWDGVNWSGFSSVFNNNLSAITFLNNEIYIGGGFTTIDGYIYNYIAKRTTQNGISENNFADEINIYPNPAQSELTIEMADVRGQMANGKYTCTIKNLFGQTLAEKTFIDKTSFDVSNWAKGMYFIELKDEKGERAGTEKLAVK